MAVRVNLKMKISIRNDKQEHIVESEELNVTDDPENYMETPSLWWWAPMVGLSVIIFLMCTTFIIMLPSSDYEPGTKEHVRFFAWLRGVNYDGQHGVMVNSINEEEKIVSCYYNTPSQSEKSQLLPSDIYPFLCTHINVAFAKIVNKEIHMENSQYQALQEIVKLKQKNPKLKILLSVGGARDDNGFSDMVKDHASRKTFIRSIKSVLKNFTLDGIDLDWEFPVIHLSDDLEGRERIHFSQLLREIRMEYLREHQDYLLTVAVAAPETIVDVAYDVDQLNMYIDYANIMTYDFHFYTTYTPFTGLNSPLYARSTEKLYFGSLNINYTVQMYIAKGLDRNKIVVGIPTYGHTFSLVNSNNTNIGSPASGYGSVSGNGYVNYPDICSFLKTFTDNVTIKYDNAAKVPYMYKDHDWISYDNRQSVMEKASFIKENKLRGAMIYSLNADDYEGKCGDGFNGDTKFPLCQSIKNTLIYNGTAEKDDEE